MEFKLILILTIMMFIMSLICIGLSVFYTFRIEKVYIDKDIKNLKKL